ncbi:integrin alpha-M-like [Mugil cephalus]|uniref:integrin alpha-M-like n=1 Tax=Mugil cephalus TaxID=48193 RepID=UPI001FB60632|nr:integrin alpha-M-like [Mugil cephalus]
MHGPRRIYVLTFTVAVAAVTALAFNVDTTDPTAYSGERENFFGFKVLSGMKKEIIITAPLNGSGKICKQERDKPIKCFQPSVSPRVNATRVKGLGMSIAADSSGSNFTVCSPSYVHECNENSYLHSVCYKITDQLDEVDSFTPAFQECTKQKVDLAFLFDGSRSMTEAEFNKNKDFIVDIMDSLNNSSIKFAAVQFSTDYNKVFDFKDFEAGTAIDKLMKEPHMKSLTNTHKALEYVLSHIFENPEAGASPDATKVLVLITDGDPSDPDRNDIVKKYDEKNIIRLVIGVKEAKLDKFRIIASEPKDKNAFQIEDYGGLSVLLENFQKRIFTMEGSKVAQAGNMTNEMSQSGFSAASYKDTLVLGSVGSNSWKGSLQVLKGKEETQVEDENMKMDSYMGYSISIGEKGGQPLLFTGAPRFEHTGKVVLFTHKEGNWNVSQNISNDQIGSYFGAELCSLDVNSNNDTDFLLVGAPLLYQLQEKKEGRIYIYTLTNEKQLEFAQEVLAPSMGRFGSTISSLADLNGDGLRDVAVGAPLEDDNRGAVYIFLGDRNKGIRPVFSQRITGEKIGGIRFFGQSIDGNFDLGTDGLPDIVIGSQGSVFVLRSKAVFNVNPRVSFDPAEISTEKFECPVKTDENLHMVTLSVCFETHEQTKTKEVVKPRLKISYTLVMDPTRQTYRGFFNQTDKKSRSLTTTLELSDTKFTCSNYSIFMPKCVKDTLWPLIVKLNFTQTDSENSSASLNTDTNRQLALRYIPFQKQCRKNDTCVAELTVDFEFGSKTLLVAENNYFNVSVNFTNHGDDSYNTSLTMHYPPGLSFSRMASAKATRPTLHSCHDSEEGVLNKTKCSISLPVYRSRSYVIFETSFRIVSDYKWEDTISMTIVGHSDNAVNRKNMSMTKNIPVQFEIKMAITVDEDTVTYLNFTTEDTGPKKINAIYKIDNIGFKDFPINVTLTFPIKLENNFEMSNYHVLVSENKTTCHHKPHPNSELCNNCIVMVCESFNLEKHAEFTLVGDVEFKKLKDQAANIPLFKKYTGDSTAVKFKSFIEVLYDSDRYVLGSYKQEEKSNNSGKGKDNNLTKRWTEARIELIFLPHKYLIIATGAGLGFLFLIILTCIMYKVGCFKRKTFGDGEEEQKEGSAKEPPQEGQPLFDEFDENGTPPRAEKVFVDELDENGTPPLQQTKSEFD